jgi:hypothetical protein
VAQDRAGELGEEALDEVEPRAMLGCEGELETAVSPTATLNPPKAKDLLENKLTQITFFIHVGVPLRHSIG